MTTRRPGQGHRDDELDGLMVPQVIAVDHPKALDADAALYRQLVHASLHEVARPKARGVAVVEVRHEPDRSCCHLEAWERTAERICRAVQDGGGPPSEFSRNLAS